MSPTFYQHFCNFYSILQTPSDYENLITSTRTIKMRFFQRAAQTFTAIVVLKFAYEPRGPSAYLRFQYHKMTRSISNTSPHPDGMLVHHRVTPSIKFAGTHLYTWVERGTVRVKCLAQEHSTMSPCRGRTRTARSRDERTNHDATVPPTF